MTSLQQGAEDYLKMRRALGFKLKRHGRFVREFIEWLERNGETRITTRLALQWATEPQHLHKSEWAARLSGVRAFARYWSTFDAASEVPPDGMLPFRAPRATPYLYSDAEIQKLLQAAREMPAQFKLQPLTYHCLLGLLAVTGLRISEALHLESRDVDWTEELLIIRSSKFGKSRFVPLHSTVKEVLAAYAARRNQVFSDRPEAAFFPSKTGACLDAGQVRRVFYRLSRQIGIRGTSASRGPRLHDFRHRYAVETLLQWYRTGEDVRRRLPVLSTYLGHGHVTDTYWYLSTTPELMGAAGQCLEKRWEVHE
ncbi:MAG TPA: tyrosine-type recombinase/integrase [Candidatus Acidoferrum sp.]|jgi:integrase|nr:tyrosine-type recombinase/integrase [Candidatus Acidoferrum sp.]